MSFKRGEKNILTSLNVGLIQEYNKSIEKIDYIEIRPKDRDSVNFSYFRIITFNDLDFDYEPGKLLTALYDISLGYWNSHKLPMYIELRKGTFQEHNSRDALTFSEVSSMIDFEKIKFDIPLNILCLAD